MRFDTQPKCLPFIGTLLEGMLQQYGDFRTEPDGNGFTQRADILRTLGVELHPDPDDTSGTVLLHLLGVFDLEPVSVEVDESICNRLGIAETSVVHWGASFSRGFYEKTVEFKISVATVQWFDEHFGKTRRPKQAALDQQWSNALDDMQRVKQKVTSLTEERKKHVVDVFADFSRKCLA